MIWLTRRNEREAFISLSILSIKRNKCKRREKDSRRRCRRRDIVNMVFRAEIRESDLVEVFVSLRSDSMLNRLVMPQRAARLTSLCVNKSCAMCKQCAQMKKSCEQQNVYEIKCITNEYTKKEMTWEHSFHFISKATYSQREIQPKHYMPLWWSSSSSWLLALVFVDHPKPYDKQTPRC